MRITRVGAYEGIEGMGKDEGTGKDESNRDVSEDEGTAPLSAITICCPSSVTATFRIVLSMQRMEVGGPASEQAGANKQV